MTLQTLTFRTLPWLPDAVQQTFKALAEQPWAMLLHSGFAEHPHNRFDILVAEPCATLVTRGTETAICVEGVSSTHHSDPLQLLQQTLDSFGHQPATHPELPFLGGALGLFGYDLGRHFEKLPEKAQADLKTPDMAIGIYDWALIADHQRQQLTLLSWGDIDARQRYLETLAADSPRAPFRLTSAWQSNMTREQYGLKFRQVQEYLKSGDCYQVNSRSALTPVTKATSGKPSSV